MQEFSTTQHLDKFVCKSSVKLENNEEGINSFSNDIGNKLITVHNNSGQ